MQDLQVTWSASEKKATAVIANTGNADAGTFLVHFNADENPVSLNNRPQVSHTVPGLARGATVTLSADFGPLAHPDNVYLTNVRTISVVVDPKGMVAEADESNNSKEMALSFNSACIDFGPPPAAGTQYGPPVHAPGQVVLVNSDTSIRMAVQTFKYLGSGSAFNRARIENPPAAFGTGQTIGTNNISLEFDFTGAGSPVYQVDLQYLDKGGFENLSVNGQPVPVYAGELSSAPSLLGGVNIVVTSAPVAGGKTGTVTFIGLIQKVTIGGQELWIDNVCARY